MVHDAEHYACAMVCAWYTLQAEAPAGPESAQARAMLTFWTEVAQCVSETRLWGSTWVKNPEVKKISQFLMRTV